MSELTQAERHMISLTLFTHARRQAKKLDNAIRNCCHPNLIVELRTEVSECSRLAVKLQDQYREVIGVAGQDAVARFDRRTLDR
jgi:hypothetical protein